LLQDAEKVHLQLQADVSDLVQEEGPVLGELQLPPVEDGGAREGPFFVPEELALQQAFRQGSAGYGNERRVRPGLSSWIARARSSFPVRFRPG